MEQECIHNVRAEHLSDHAEISQLFIGLLGNTFGLWMFQLIFCEGGGECFQKLTS